MHSYLGKESAKSCYLCVGRELFVCQGMIFGLTVSPQKYQMLNNVLVGNMVRHGHDVLLYLDDRLTSSLITRANLKNDKITELNIRKNHKNDKITQLNISKKPQK